MNLVGYRNISIVDALHRTIRQAHDQVHSEGDRYGNQIEGGAARTQGGNGGWRQRRRIQWLIVGRGWSSTMPQQGCHRVTVRWISIEIVHIFVYPLYLLLQIQMFEYKFKFEWVNSSQSNNNEVFTSPPTSPKGPPRTDFTKVVRLPVVASFRHGHPPLPPRRGANICINRNKLDQ
jgi:hypothetical protein